MMMPNPKVFRRILVVTLSNLGDVVLTLPVFQSLSQAFPNAKLDVIIGPAAKMVFEGDPRIRKIIPYDKKISWGDKWRFIQEIRHEHYDIIVDLRFSLIGLLGGGRLRNRYLFFRTKKKRRALRHLEALRGIAPCDEGQSFLQVRSQSLPGDLADQGKIVAAAVGSKSDIKKWPAEYYAALLDKLALNDGCRIVLVGDKHDMEDAEKVKALMKSRSTDLSGQTSFSELAAVIQKASLLVTNDSAPLHIADALKVPTLAVFGPTDPEKYGPRFSSSLAARSGVFCSPCERAQCHYHHECMKELGIDEVYAKAVRILNDETGPADIKILMIRLDRIGDVVLSLPAILAVRERFPKAHIALMTRPTTQPLVEGNPLIDEVIPYFYEKKGRHRSVVGNFRFIYEIIRRKFDIVFILNPSLRSYLVPFCAGIPYRVGFKSWPFLLTHSAEDRRHEGKRHEAEYTLDVVRAFGVEAPAAKKNILPVTHNVSLKISWILEKFSCKANDRILAIHPGASCISKKWPKERFAQLGKKILTSTPYRLAIVGGKEEVDLGKYLASEWGETAIDLTGKLDLKELAAFLKRCELLISNDSGPVHVAAAVGTRTISIFGRNQSGLSPARWKPLGEGHAVIQKDVGCVVCLAHRCTIDFECLKAVTVEEVFVMAKKMLSENVASHAAQA